MTNTMRQHGAFSWSELLTTDPAAAKEFYAQLFGWTMVEEEPRPGMKYTILKAGDQQVGGLMAMPADMPPHIPSHWGVYVTVDDVEASVKQAEELGGSINHYPDDIPGVGRFAVVQDPQGATLTLITYNANYG